MKKQYTKKQIMEAIVYWKKQLAKLNESNHGKRPFIFLLEPKNGNNVTAVVHYSQATNVKDSGELANAFSNWAILNHPQLFQEYQVRNAESTKDWYPVNENDEEFQFIWDNFWNSEDEAKVAVLNSPFNVLAGVDADYASEFKKYL